MTAASYDNGAVSPGEIISLTRYGSDRRPASRINRPRKERS
jgi:hypothetical protein